MYATCAHLDHLAERCAMGADNGLPKYYNPSVDLRMSEIGWMIYVGGDDRRFSYSTHMWHFDDKLSSFIEVSDDHKKDTIIFGGSDPDPVKVVWLEPGKEGVPHEFMVKGPTVSLLDISRGVCDYYREHDSNELPKRGIALGGFKVFYRIRTVYIIWEPAQDCVV